MVTFARYPDSLCPLTLDHDTLLALLDQVDIVSVPEEDGTAIGEAMALGVERLKDSMAKSRIMLVLTDGVNNAGETEPLPGRPDRQGPRHQNLHHWHRDTGRGDDPGARSQRPDGVATYGSGHRRTDAYRGRHAHGRTILPRYGWCDTAGHLRRDRSA